MSETAKDIKATEKKGWIYFGVMAGFMLIATLGWDFAMDTLGYWTRKEPVAWPARVKVNAKTFQNLTMATKFGPFRRVEEDGVLDFNRDKDGRKTAKFDGEPDGELEFREDVMETLKVGTSLDEKRLPQRMSNWYVSRIYEDTREPANSPLKYWTFSVVFYTGSEVTVPHVPDICVQSGGATLKDRQVLSVPITGAPEPWDKEAKLAALSYESTQRGQTHTYVQYYLFDVNGLPETSRDTTRLILTKPTTRYVFYAKLQFAPRNNVYDAEVANRHAMDFLKYALPSILKELPSHKDIERLYEK